MHEDASSYGSCSIRRDWKKLDLGDDERGEREPESSKLEGGGRVRGEGGGEGESGEGGGGQRGRGGGTRGAEGTRRQSLSPPPASASVSASSQVSTIKNIWLRMDERTNRRTDRGTDGRTDGQMDGRTVGRTDGRVDGNTLS